MKQLGRRGVEPYIEVLPASPTEFLRLYPGMARAVFSATNLPVQCPVNRLAISSVRAKINMRSKPVLPSTNITNPNNMHGGQMQGLHAHA